MKKNFLLLIFGIFAISLSAQNFPRSADSHADRIVSKLDQALTLTESQRSDIHAAAVLMRTDMPERTPENVGFLATRKQEFVTEVEKLLSPAQLEDFDAFKTRFLGK